MQRKMTIVAMVIAAAAMVRAVSAQQTSQWDGVYTAEQAKRGEPLFTEFCAVCHGPDLSGGDVGPPLAGSAFNSNWNTLDLGQLFEFMNQTMPQNNPGSLTPQQTADILAFVLQKGTFPAGPSDLPTETEMLKTIKFLSTKPGAK